MSMRIDLGLEFLCFHHNNKIYRENIEREYQQNIKQDCGGRGGLITMRRHIL